MEAEKKEKLLKYLYPTEHIRSFMCNDLYVELGEIIPTNICISSKNLKTSVRHENYKKVSSIITEFLSNNKTYAKMLMELFNKKDLLDIIPDIITGYVFFIANTKPRCNDDIFKDKKNICYTPISVLDIL